MYFQLIQLQELWKWFAVRFCTCSTIVRHGEHGVSVTKLQKLIAEFIVVDLWKITVITISADALIWWIHVHEIVLSAIVENCFVIPRREPRSAPQ